MDSNDPTNSNSNPPTAAPTPMDPNSMTPVQPPPTTFNNPQNPSDQIISDIPQLPPNAPVPPHASAGSPWGPPEAPPSPAPAPTSPWGNPPPSTDTPGSVPLPDPATQTGQAPAPQSPWSPSSEPAATAADVPTAPPAPTDASNPFLQPQAGTNFSVPQTTFDQMPMAATPPPPEAAAAAVPNPMTTTTPDPLNTAFSPSGAPQENPFAQPPSPGSPEAPGSTPAAPLTSPWETPTTSPEALAPAAAQPDNQTTPQATPQSGTLDLSSLQNPQPTETSQQSTQPGNINNPQGNSPVENAPTDLSHLIAGDESSSPQQPMGNVYNPPVAPDQSTGTALPQTPATEGGSAAPPEKHLNLTKVLLVAGIPIILVVAALSAYLILGVGKAAPEDTSLPVEQTKQDQAPLTNPPQQIVAPSPATIPEPSVASLPEAPSPSPSATSSSPTSAMEKLKARQASPSPTASASPASSDSLSLPN